MGKSADKTYERVMTPHPERRQKLWEMAETLRHITDGRQEDIFAAFADLDEVPRPGQKKITRDDISQAAKDDTRFRLGDVNPFLESVCRTPELLKNELMAIRSFRFLDKLTKRRSERLATRLMPEPGYHGATVTRFANEIAGKEFQTVVQEAGLAESDITKQLISIEMILHVTEYQADVYRNSKTGEKVHAAFMHYYFLGKQRYFTCSTSSGRNTISKG